MFDVSFSELLIIGVVALLVVGPERLPKLARTAGLLLGRLQRYVNDVKADINREMQLDELKRLQQQVQESARELEASVKQELDSAKAEVAGVGSELTSVRDSVRKEWTMTDEKPVGLPPLASGGEPSQPEPAKLAAGAAAAQAPKARDASPSDPGRS